MVLIPQTGLTNIWYLAIIKMLEVLEDFQKASRLPKAVGRYRTSHVAGNKISEVFLMFSDKVLVCKECGREFEFTASEQEFYAEKGFTNEPGRCPECRAARKQNRNNGGSGYSRQPREMFSAICATCGKETTVPFQPSGDRPVYCRDCYQPRSRNNW